MVDHVVTGFRAQHNKTLQVIAIVTHAKQHRMNFMGAILQARDNLTLAGDSAHSPIMPVIRIF